MQDCLSLAELLWTKRVFAFVRKFYTPLPRLTLVDEVGRAGLHGTGLSGFFTPMIERRRCCGGVMFAGVVAGVGFGRLAAVRE